MDSGRDSTPLCSDHWAHDSLIDLKARGPGGTTGVGPAGYHVKKIFWLLLKWSSYRGQICASNHCSNPVTIDVNVHSDSNLWPLMFAASDYTEPLFFTLLPNTVIYPMSLEMAV